MKNISKKIKELRLKRKLTLEELGNRINFNFSNLSKIERGVRDPTIELLEKLAEFYDLPITYFFGEQQEVPEELKQYGVEWVSVVEEAVNKDLTPDEIKAVIEMLNQLKNK